MFVEFMTWYTIGMLALSFERIKGMIRIIIAIRVIISGALIPIEYMPKVFQKISTVVPFQCCVYVPAQMLIGEEASQKGWFYLGICVGWIVILSIISKCLWTLGCSKVQSNMA